MSRTVLVCQHETCPLQGSQEVFRAFKNQAPPDVEVKSAGCLGECGSGPMVLVFPEKIWYCGVKLKDVPRIIEQHLIQGKLVQEKLYPKYHPPTQSRKIWLSATSLVVALLALFLWFLMSQSDYL